MVAHPGFQNQEQQRNPYVFSQYFHCIWKTKKSNVQIFKGLPYIEIQLNQLRLKSAS